MKCRTPTSQPPNFEDILRVMDTDSRSLLMKSVLNHLQIFLIRCVSPHRINDDNLHLSNVCGNFMFTPPFIPTQRPELKAIGFLFNEMFPDTHYTPLISHNIYLFLRLKKYLGRMHSVNKVNVKKQVYCWLKGMVA